MRIYLIERKVVTDAKGCEKTYASQSFFANVPKNLADEWIAAGSAYDATDDNKVKGFKNSDPVVVDVASGESLEGIRTQLPKPKPKPKVHPKPQDKKPPANPVADDGKDK